jgi:hypothetical protein
MHILHRIRKQIIRVIGFIATKQEGAALIVSLLVLLVLVLLGLSLMLQSGSDYVQAVNENDAMEALSYGESALDWGGRLVKDYAGTGAPDLTELLNGPDNVSTADDNLIGFRTISTTLALADLRSTCTSPAPPECEQTTSVIFNFDWNNDGTDETYEAFRVGRDENGDGTWDGPRSIVYVRIEDNYDEDGVDQPLVDQDFKARIKVMSDYPIFVDSDGAAEDVRVAARGVARRRIIGKFQPMEGIAIRTDGDFIGNGSPRLCGACGGVHANDDMDIIGGDVKICADATASDVYSQNANPPIRGETGWKEEQFIPIINPYDPLYVPAAADFNHTGDFNYAQPLGTVLQCPGPSAADPGSSKYFALVWKKIDSAKHLQVYKAYWDFTSVSGAPRWLWRLIDELDPAIPLDTLNAVLDNCGRVVSGSVGGVALVPDPSAGPGVSDDVDVTNAAHPYPACVAAGNCTPDDVIDANDAGSGDAHFYGFGGNNIYRTSSCACINEHGEPDTLSTTADNDYTRQAFWLYPAGTPNADANVPALPVDPTGNNGSDGQRDFICETALAPPRAEWKIITGGSYDPITMTYTNPLVGAVFSPLFNSVIWVYGNVEVNGSSLYLRYYDPDTSLTEHVTLPDNFWRVTLVSYGRVVAAGTPKYAPFLGTTPEWYPVGMAAGRDVDLSGGSVYPPACPDFTDPATQCDIVTPLAPAGYEGIFVAHEQIEMSGGVNLIGFLIAEHQDECVETNPPGEVTQLNGEPSVYYDCETPPNPWAGEGGKIGGWEEVQ